MCHTTACFCHLPNLDHDMANIHCQLLSELPQRQTSGLISKGIPREIQRGSEESPYQIKRQRRDQESLLSVYTPCSAFCSVEMGGEESHFCLGAFPTMMCCPSKLWARITPHPLKLLLEEYLVTVITN